MMPQGSLVAELVLWFSAALIGYAYLGYPLTLAVLPRKRRAPSVPDPSLPAVSILIAAHNEETCIAGTIENKLSLDYPAQLLEIIVVSDGSTDRTEEIVRTYGDPRVRLVRQEQRQGKTAALNRARELAHGEILVISDANSQYESGALRRLAAELADPEVGYVTGKLIYVDAGGAALGRHSGLYMNYENALRRLESEVGSIIGVNGGIDAVRASLFEPMEPHHLPDFILPLRVMARGYRVVFAPRAINREIALEEDRDEFKMRIRVCLRSLHALFEMRAMLNPFRGLSAFQLLVHKVLRYSVVWLLIVIAVSNLFLLHQPLYRATLTLQGVFYLSVLGGFMVPGLRRFAAVGVPFYFMLLNVACGAAWLSFFLGRQQVTWTPRKGA